MPTNQPTPPRTRTTARPAQRTPRPEEQPEEQPVEESPVVVDTSNEVPPEEYAAPVFSDAELREAARGLDIPAGMPGFPVAQARRIAHAGDGQNLTAALVDHEPMIADDPRNYILDGDAAAEPTMVTIPAAGGGELHLPVGAVAPDFDFAAQSQRVAEHALEACEATLITCRNERDALNDRIRDLVAQREVLNTQVSTWRRYVRRQLQDATSRRVANP